MQEASHKRLQVVDYGRFPATFVAFGRSFFTSLPQDTTPWLSVIYPFTPFMWMASILTVVCFPFVSYIAFNFRDRVPMANVVGWMLNVLLGRGEE